MKRILNNITELIGNTPLLEIANYNSQNGINGKIIAKLEYFNPGGSVKDRVGYAMIADAENRGLINKDTVIIEPTSGIPEPGICLRQQRATGLYLQCPNNEHGKEKPSCSTWSGIGSYSRFGRDARCY